MKPRSSNRAGLLQNFLLKYLRYFFAGTLFIVIATYKGFSQTNGTSITTLSPEAQAAIDKGIMAAKLPDYVLAINFFEEARKLAPQSPEIFFNLGLAESKVPGRELRAICWFSAYLMVDPTAPNAAAVKDQINVLDIKSQSNLFRLIKSVQDAAEQISVGNRLADMRYVWTLWARSGDIPAALKTVDLLQQGNLFDGHESEGQAEISGIEARTGDIAGARETADLIQDAYWKSMAQTYVAEAQIKAGDITGAKETLAIALKTVELINDTKNPTEGVIDKSRAQVAVAEAQTKAGDITGAKETLAIALKTTELIHEANAPKYEDVLKGREQASVAVAQAKAGDKAGAQRTANFIVDAFFKSTAQKGIDEAIDETITKPGQKTVTKVSAQPAVTVIKVSDWLYKLDNKFMSVDCALNTDPFLDLPGYLTAQRSDDSQIFFKKLGATAEKILAAQNIIDKMLKQQSKP